MLKSSALVTQLDTIKVVISLVAQKEWTIYQLDVKSAFLPEGLSEEVYVEPPSKQEEKGSEPKVYKLQRTLYGLKQARRD